MHLSGLRRFKEDNLDEEDRQGCFFFLAASAILCISAVLSWREVVYLARGRTVNADVLRVYDVRGRGAGAVIEFEFTDPQTGQLCRHSDKLRLGWRPAPGPLPVEYVSGAATYARVAGYTNRWSLWVLGGSLIAAMLYLGRLIHEANAPVRRKRRYNRERLD